jgi:hypothetical protein
MSLTCRRRVAAATAVLMAVLADPAGQARAATPPRLAVVISIDQLRYDYLDRFGSVFSAGGFRRLREQGVDFRDCHYRHAFTKTAPGHAVILGGVHADVHGIVGNEWIDRRTWQSVNAVEDAAAPLVGATPRTHRSPGGVLEAKEGRSPRNFDTTTVGDELKLRHGVNARVVSIDNKDRAAILMGGRLADAVYWFDRGRFVTSTYYRAALPDWVERFNSEGRMERYFGQTWDRLLAPDLYEQLAGADAAEGEDPSFGLGRTFPRRIDGGKPEMGNDYLNAFPLTPFYSEMLAEFAKVAVQAEQLGRHPATDLLCLGFSQIDHTGHSFGPDSQEVMDALVRLDRIMADLLRFLDREVGAGDYIVVLTADHGVAPLPERVKAMHRDIDCGRLDHASITRAVEQALNAAWGAPAAPLYWVTRDATGYHFRPETLQAKNITAPQAGAVVRAALRLRPEIAAAYTREDFSTAAPLDQIGEMVRRSYNRERSPDVVYVLKPYWVDRARAGTNHGSPYNYDTHVPLLWYGKGLKPAVHAEAVGVDDLAPTLSGLLGLPSPPQAMGRRLF